MTSRLELTLTANIFQQQGCILPSTLNGSIRLRANMLFQFVDNEIYDRLSLLTSATKEHKDFIKHSQSITNKMQFISIYLFL